MSARGQDTTRTCGRWARPEERGGVWPARPNVRRPWRRAFVSRRRAHGGAADGWTKFRRWRSAASAPTSPRRVRLLRRRRAWSLAAVLGDEVWWGIVGGA